MKRKILSLTEIGKVDYRALEKEAETSSCINMKIDKQTEYASLRQEILDSMAFPTAMQVNGALISWGVRS